MASSMSRGFQRREFLRAVGGVVAGALSTTLAQASDLPQNTGPRAIFGDAIEPAWNQRVTITVGLQQADLVGSTDRVLQAAVDYVARRGGGTVRVLPGTYRLRNSIFLQSSVRLAGSGADSVLVKEPSVTTKLIVDGDHWDQEVTLADPQGFQVGDGVRLVAKDPYGKGTNIVQRTLIAIDINGETESVVILKNELRETRSPQSRIGILIGAETRDIRCEDNQIEGFAIPIKDLHQG